MCSVVPSGTLTSGPGISGARPTSAKAGTTALVPSSASGNQRPFTISSFSSSLPSPSVPAGRRLSLAITLATSPLRADSLIAGGRNDSLPSASRATMTTETPAFIVDLRTRNDTLFLFRWRVGVADLGYHQPATASSLPDVERIAAPFHGLAVGAIDSRGEVGIVVGHRSVVGEVDALTADR